MIVWDGGLSTTWAFPGFISWHKQLECEIEKIRITKSDNVVSDNPTAKDKIVLNVHKDRNEAEKNDKETKNEINVCRYFNRGYCKYKF